MNVANSLWGQDGAALQSEFLGPIARHSIDCSPRAYLLNGVNGARRLNDMKPFS